MKKLITTILAILILNAGVASGQTNYFTNAVTANWSVSNAWTLGVPTALQDVFHTNTTTGAVSININSSAFAQSITAGGSGGTAQIVMMANQTLTVGSNIVLAPGAGGAELRLGTSNATLIIDGGNGSIINGGGSGLASLNVQGGFSNSVGLLNASVDDLNMGQTGSGTLIINSGQTYNVANRLRLNNASTVANSTATILMNGGTLNYGGSTATSISFNSGTNANNRAYIILNSNSLLTAKQISKEYLGTDAAIHWNDGTIGNFINMNLNINANANAGTMDLYLSETGSHTFDTQANQTITLGTNSLIKNKSGEHGTLNKTGGGTLLFSGNHSYTGQTMVTQGSFIVNGSLLSSNTVINTGATLGGSGTLQSVTLNGGSLSPGNSPGLLNMASLDASNGNFVFEIGAPTTRGVTYDAINVQGLLTLGSMTTWNFNVLNNYTFAEGDTYDLFDWGTLEASTFDSSVLLAALPDLDTVNPQLQWSVESFGVDGTVSVIPEPSTLDLLSLPFKLLIQVCRTLNYTQIYNIVSHVNTHELILAGVY